MPEEGGEKKALLFLRSTFPKTLERNFWNTLNFQVKLKFWIKPKTDKQRFQIFS